jgi:hypothetical protein
MPCLLTPDVRAQCWRLIATRATRHIQKKDPGSARVESNREVHIKGPEYATGFVSLIMYWMN